MVVVLLVMVLVVLVVLWLLEAVVEEAVPLVPCPGQARSTTALSLANPSLSRTLPWRSSSYRLDNPNKPFCYSALADLRCFGSDTRFYNDRPRRKPNSGPPLSLSLPCPWPPSLGHLAPVPCPGALSPPSPSAVPPPADVPVPSPAPFPCCGPPS